MTKNAIREAITSASEINAPAQNNEAGPCPVTMLGHLDGRFYFLDATGQLRILSASQVGKREDLMALFLDEGIWLTDAFPCRRAKKITRDDGSEAEEFVTVDFAKNKASAWLMAECRKAGLFGEHIKIRRPGVWPGCQGRPVVHCGDVVLPIGKKPLPVGSREGRQVWAAAPAEERPANVPAGTDIAGELQSAIGRLWNFRRDGGDVVMIGLLGCAYLGATIPWRPAGFITGAAGSGKSSLLSVLRAACPMAFYTNDTTKAGVEQSLEGRAVPTFIDEASDREDQRGARTLLDLVLSASGGEGAKGSRGGKDGKARQIEVAGSILMASIAPPDMKAQHFGRFTIIDLDKAKEGHDYHSEHKRLLTWAHDHGPGLWRRALEGWERFHQAALQFRHSLGQLGCSPRDMDQMSTLLAGYWILLWDGLPSRDEADKAVSWLGDYIRDQEDVLMQDASTQMINHLMSQIVQVQRSTERRSIADLIRRVLGEGQKTPYPELAYDEELSCKIAAEVLAQYGIRVIRADDVKKNIRGVAAPRMADGVGIWFWPGSAPLQGLFRDTPFSGQKFIFELKRLESSRQYKDVLRIGANRARGCIWVSGDELGFSDGAHDA